MTDLARKEKLYIIGFGPGDESFVGQKALDIIAKAELVLSSDRLGESLPNVQGSGLVAMNEAILSFAERNRELDEKDGNLVVLVSGDSGFYSLAKSLIANCAELYDVEVLPGIGSISYFAAKIQKSYDDARLVSLHGRNDAIVPKVTYNQKVFALAGGENSVGYICEHLTKFGLGDVQVTVGERLSYADERILTGTAEQFQTEFFDDLAVVYIENPNHADPHLPLSDADFIRSDVPMTKEEVRWLSVAKMRVNPGDVIYDVGAGSGSVAIELARRAYDGFVYAIDSDPEACELIKANVAKHAAYNVDVVLGEATAMMRWLPIPDKAFIGGSSNKMDEIIRWLTAENPSIRIVVNVVTLQNLFETQRAFERYGVGDVDIVCINAARATRRGNYDMMTANNPVYIISGSASGVTPDRPRRTSRRFEERAAERAQRREENRAARDMQPDDEQSVTGRLRRLFRGEGFDTSKARNVEKPSEGASAPEVALETEDAHEPEATPETNDVHEPDKDSQSE